jgi:hypothetical protein
VHAVGGKGSGESCSCSMVCCRVSSVVNEGREGKNGVSQTARRMRRASEGHATLLD